MSAEKDARIAQLQDTLLALLAEKAYWISQVPPERREEVAAQVAAQVTEECGPSDPVFSSCSGLPSASTAAPPSRPPPPAAPLDLRPCEPPWRSRSAFTPASTAARPSRRPASPSVPGLSAAWTRWWAPPRRRGVPLPPLGRRILRRDRKHMRSPAAPQGRLLWAGLHRRTC